MVLAALLIENGVCYLAAKSKFAIKAENRS